MPSTYPPTLTAALMGQPIPDSAELICVAVTEAVAKSAIALSTVQKTINQEKGPFRDLLNKEQTADAVRKFAKFLSRDEETPNLPARISALMTSIDLYDDQKLKSYFLEHGDRAVMLYGSSISTAIDCMIEEAQSRLDVTRDAVRDAMKQSILVAPGRAAVDGVRIPAKTAGPQTEQHLSGEQAVQHKPT